MKLENFDQEKYMKILLTTSYFPAFDVDYPDPRTKFLYYYAVEWVKQGHEVLVLHSIPRYPYFLSRMICLGAKKAGIENTQLTRLHQHRKAVQSANYSFAGINIIRNPILKLIPHRDFFSFELRKHKANVLKSFKESAFDPDIVISDFVTPSAYIANEIRIRNKMPFYQILHQNDFQYLKKPGTKLRKAFEQANGVLFRSYHYSKLFEQKGFSASYKDYIFSGVPNNILMGNVRKRIKKLLYVGSLRLTKNIHVILQAIAECQSKKHYELEIIGDGPYEKELRLLVNKLGLNDQVVFGGRLSRDKVFKKMLATDCLIMVSKETYGMVYIEAMSQGCIVIAAKKQGIDGIVVNGENGFLIECGNVKELTELLDRLMLMDEQEIMRISENGIQTVRQMTDGQLAKDLLERLNAHLKHSRESISNR